MLKRRARLGRERLTELMKTGARAHGRLFTCVYKRGTEPGASVVVSKKVAKSSVERHKIRRRAYAALEGVTLPYSMVLIAKDTARTARPALMREEIERMHIRKV